MKKYIFLIFVITVTIIFCLFIFFKKNGEIKIGFVGGLSGKYSVLGHSTLNGLLLAFDDVNDEIDGKKIKVIIKDDMQDDEVAKKIINSFIDDKVNLIVGNITSSMTKASLSQIPKDSNFFLFSPTSSSSLFSNIDDNFFRIQVARTKERFDLLSKYLIEKNLLNLYAIYDEKNSSYSKSYLENFQESFISLGGKQFVGETTINNRYENILEKIKAFDNLDGIFIVANSLDSSKLIQFLRLNKIDKKIYVSGWAKNSEFIEEGGKAVEGVLFLDSYNEKSTNKKYLDFKKKYKEKFHIEPTSFSAVGYETGSIILDILKKDSNLQNFKKTLLSIKEFEGLQGYILFDKYGDVQREQNLTIVKDNKFIKVK